MPYTLWPHCQCDSVRFAFAHSFISEVSCCVAPQHLVHWHSFGIEPGAGYEPDDVNAYRMLRIAWRKSCVSELIALVAWKCSRFSNSFIVCGYVCRFSHLPLVTILSACQSDRTDGRHRTTDVEWERERNFNLEIEWHFSWFKKQFRAKKRFCYYSRTHSSGSFHHFFFVNVVCSNGCFFHRSFVLVICWKIYRLLFATVGTTILHSQSASG